MENGWLKEHDWPFSISAVTNGIPKLLSLYSMKRVGDGLSVSKDKGKSVFKGARVQTERKIVKR